jgi:hypothetical protein
MTPRADASVKRDFYTNKNEGRDGIKPISPLTVFSERDSFSRAAN